MKRCPAGVVLATSGGGGILLSSVFRNAANYETIFSIALLAGAVAVAWLSKRRKLGLVSVFILVVLAAAYSASVGYMHSTESWTMH
jgi:hypothetical protein